MRLNQIQRQIKASRMDNLAPRRDLVFDLHISMEFAIYIFIEATHVRQPPLLTPVTPLDCAADHGFS
jgi:hypothetical protein